MLNDSAHFLSRLSCKKIGNYGQSIFAYIVSRVIKKPFIFGFPSSISIEPTTRCNLYCPECPTGRHEISRSQGNIDLSLYKKTVDELAPFLCYLNLYFQGEPYLHPNLFELIHYAHQKKIYTATSTNGHFLSPENAKKTIDSGLSRIFISVDGTTQESYSLYRKGGELNKVIEGVRALVALKKKLQVNHPFIILQFLVFKHNQHQVKEVKKLGKKLGVNKTFIKSAQLYNYEKGHPFITSLNRYSRYKKLKNGEYIVKNKNKKNCKKLWVSSVITCSGIVAPCCFDKNGKYPMGNMGESTFEEIWKRDNYNNFRKMVLQKRVNIPICQNCTERLSIAH